MSTDRPTAVISEPNNKADQRTFHPVNQRNQDAWFPGDEGASLLIAIQHVWEDIERIANLRAQPLKDYDRKLLLKYLIMEVHSLIRMMDRLRTKVMSAEVYESSERPLYRGISSEDQAIAREHWARYSEAKKAVEIDLSAVRNKLAAHRDISDWRLVMTLWDKLDSKLILALLQAVPSAFNHAKELNIFEWNRRTEDGTIEFLGGPISLWDDEVSS